MATIQITTTNEYYMAVQVVSLQPGLQPLARQLGQVDVLAPASQPQQRTVVYRASGDVSQVDGTTSVPTTYTELAQPLPAVKGMADLLVITVGTYSIAPGLRYADVYVKLSDREV